MKCWNWNWNIAGAPKTVREQANVAKSTAATLAQVAENAWMYSSTSTRTYLIFVIFFTQAKFLENKVYTEKRQFFALNL